jgi:hypothetical protein
MRSCSTTNNSLSKSVFGKHELFFAISLARIKQAQDACERLMMNRELEDGF